MAELSAIVGVIVPALHGTRLLRENIENITDAPKAVASLKEDLLSVGMAIKSLEAVEASEWRSLGQAVENQSKFAISTCKTACDTFMEGLQHWTKHSEHGKLTLWDRVNVGFFQKEKMKSLSAQLQNCRTTINSVASIAALHSSIRQTNMTERLEATIKVREVEITTAIATRREQIEEVEHSLRDMSIAEPGLRGDEATEREEVLKQFTKEREALLESQILLEGLLAKTKERTGISITNVRISGEGSRSNVGIFNTSTDGITLFADNIDTSSGGRSIVGVANNVPFDKFFD